MEREKAKEIEKEDRDFKNSLACASYISIERITKRVFFYADDQPLDYSDRRR